MGVVTQASRVLRPVQNSMDLSRPKYLRSQQLNIDQYSTFKSSSTFFNKLYFLFATMQIHYNDINLH